MHTLTLRITPELAAAIRAEARAQNTKSRTLVRDVLAHVFGTATNPPPLTRKEWEAGVSAKVAELAAHYGRPKTKTLRAILKKHLTQRYPALWKDSMDIDTCIAALQKASVPLASFHRTQTDLLAEYFDMPAYAYK